MRRSDRRTFLANGVRTGAAAIAGSAVPTLAAPAVAGADTPTGRPGPPAALTVNGVRGPIGVDPDDVNFAWRVSDGRRGARQGGYRIEVWPRSAGDGPPARPVWDSGWVREARQAFVAHGGSTLAADTEYRWRVRTADAGGGNGPWSAPGTFVTGLRAGDWSAQWLRPGPAAAVPEESAYLRTVVRPSSNPILRATAYVAAAHKYQLWANGQMAGSGPCFAYPDEAYYQATDLTGVLQAGQVNAVGLLHHWYGAGNGRPPAVPGALLQLSVHHADGTREVFGTGADWKELPAEWQPAPPRNTECHDFVEIIDGRQSPLGWSDPDYDDGHWEAPTVLGPAGTTPFTALFAQRTWIEEHPVAPVSVHTLANGSVVVDFGKIYAARPTVAFRHGAAGRTVNMHVGYLLDSDGQVSTTHGTQGTDLSFTYVQRAGAQRFVPFTFLGFRYLQVDSPGEPLPANRFAALARHAAMPSTDPSSFSSSDDTLDAVWGLCTHSALYASHEQFVDTPTRQKGQFTCDSTNESQAIMHAFSDQNQTWQGLRDFARSQARYWPGGQINDIYPSGTYASTIPDFSELYVEWLWRYYQRTGDTATLAAFYPVAQRIGGYVAASVDPATGLVTNLPGGGSTYPGGAVDWPPQMRYGYDMTTAARTLVNVLGANVFNRLALMAPVVGDASAAGGYRSQGAAITDAINARLIGPDGVYIDGLEPDGSQSRHASQQANALALAYGLVPADHVAAVGAHVASLGIALGPDHGLELVRGLHAAGLDDHIVRILTDPEGPGWAHILAKGGTFCWESWTPNDAEQDSLSHGWGSGALAGMQEALLGVTVLGVGPGTTSTSATGGVGGSALAATPGETLLQVIPPSGGLRAASGHVPTVAGPVRVQWARQGRGAGGLSLSLSLPANTSARVEVPAAAPAKVTESGRPATSSTGVTVLGHGDGHVLLAVGAGTYSFQVAG
ncbi:MAG TPA: family 78 glycoside hydrolase catalytic domain [Acidimicrobiales bacterium]|nr:family 78 glycoside hydrolase catalytic domain [Acidimicrobiales bacterium]